MTDNKGMVDVLLGMAIWGVIIYLLVRLVLKKAKGNTANASANAEAVAEGGDAASGASAGVNVYIVLGNNSGIVPGIQANDPRAIITDVPRLLAGGIGELDGAGIAALHSGEFQQDAGGNVARSVHDNSASRRPRRRDNLAVGE